MGIVYLLEDRHSNSRSRTMIAPDSEKILPLPQCCFGLRKKWNDDCQPKKIRPVFLAWNDRLTYSHFRYKTGLRNFDHYLVFFIAIRSFVIFSEILKIHWYSYFYVHNLPSLSDLSVRKQCNKITNCFN